MSRLLRYVSLLALFSISTICVSAQAAGLPSKLKVGDYTLIQNGAGARSKNLLQLYLAGLYLREKNNQAAAIIADDAPMAIRIEITSIFVSQQSLVEALGEGFQNSTGGDTAAIQKEIETFRRCFSDDIAKGDVFDIAYLPSVGVIVAKNGAHKGVIAGLAFKQALFGIWLSNAPADERLKQAMLGNNR